MIKGLRTNIVNSRMSFKASLGTHICSRHVEETVRFLENDLQIKTIQETGY